MTTTFDLQRAALTINGTAVEKHVLLVLATRADASKHQCTPGIPRIAADTGLSERSVMRAVASLRDAGHITQDVKLGVGTVYTVHPCTTVTPDTESPLTDSPNTPDTESPKQPRTPIPKKTSSSRVARTPKRATSFPANFHPVMTGKTASAVDGWPPGRLDDELERFADHHTAKGTTSFDWQASWRTWVKNTKRWEPRNGSNRQSSFQRPQRVDGFTAALRQVAGSQAPDRDAYHGR